MQTLAEVTQMLQALEQNEGKKAASAWVVANAKNLPQDVREEILFRFSTDAFIEETAHLGELNQVIEEATTSLEALQTDRNATQNELKKLDVQERLKGNS